MRISADERSSASPPLRVLRAALDTLDGDPELEPSLAGFNPLGNFDDRESEEGGTYVTGTTAPLIAATRESR